MDFFRNMQVLHFSKQISLIPVKSTLIQCVMVAHFIIIGIFGQCRSYDLFLEKEFVVRIFRLLYSKKAIRLRHVLIYYLVYCVILVATAIINSVPFIPTL